MTRKLLGLAIATCLCGCGQRQPPSTPNAKYAEALQIYTGERLELDRLVTLRDRKKHEADDIARIQTLEADMAFKREEVARPNADKPLTKEEKDARLKELVATGSPALVKQIAKARQEERELNQKVAQQANRVIKAEEERDRLAD
jgi:hypothetical protein